LVVGTEHWLDS